MKRLTILASILSMTLCLRAQWNIVKKQFPDFEVSAIQISEDGYYMLTNYARRVPERASGGQNYSHSIIHLDRDFQPLWEKKFPEDEAILFQCMRVGKDAIYLCGKYYDKNPDHFIPRITCLDLNGHIRWERRFTAPPCTDGAMVSLNIAPDGDLLVSGTEGNCGTSQGHATIARFSPEGVMKWCKRMGAQYHISALGEPIFTQDGNLVYLGQYGKTKADFDREHLVNWMVKIDYQDPNKVIWERELPQFFQLGFELPNGNFGLFCDDPTRTDNAIRAVASSSGEILSSERWASCGQIAGNFIARERIGGNYVMTSFCDDYFDPKTNSRTREATRMLLFDENFNIVDEIRTPSKAVRYPSRTHEGGVVAVWEHTVLIFSPPSTSSR